MVVLSIEAYSKLVDDVENKLDAADKAAKTTIIEKYLAQKYL